MDSGHVTGIMPWKWRKASRKGHFSSRSIFCPLNKYVTLGANQDWVNDNDIVFLYRT